MFEVELADGANDARGFFSNLRQARSISNLLSRAVMAYGERKLLIEHPAEWRIIHGELIPYELRTGAGNPGDNLGPAFDLIYDYIASEHFIAVSEGPEDLYILNAAILLEPGEYLVLRKLEVDLQVFLEGDLATAKAGAAFSQGDKRRFREFIQRAGPQVEILLIKAGQRPFLVECHKDQTDRAAALFLVDSLWTRGLPVDGSALAVHNFAVDNRKRLEGRSNMPGRKFRRCVASHGAPEIRWRVRRRVTAAVTSLA